MEPELQRDSEGFVRLSMPVNMTERQYDEVIEQLWVKAEINVKKRQLSKTFAEHDKVFGSKERHPKKWTDEERKYVLKTVDTDCDTVGTALGRSGMSIYMQRAQLLADFESWLMDDGKKFKSASRDEQINEFLSDSDGDDEDEGDEE